MSHPEKYGVVTHALPWLLLLYCAASLLHFVHNAEYVTEYPNLPAWISRASIYGAWLAIFSIGLLGYLLYRGRYAFLGLILLAIYTALGFDGLLHYARAPFAAHAFGMNATIWIEVVAAALAFGAVAWLAVTCFLQQSHSRSASPPDEEPELRATGRLPAQEGQE